VKKPFVSIIIPVRNSEATLEECLESLKKQDYPKSRYEIVIADDNSKDRTVELAKKHGAKVVESIGPPGRQRNDAIAASKGLILGFIDSDCVATKDWISKGVENFIDSDTAIVGGPNFTHPKDPDIAHYSGYVFSSRAGSATMSARYTNRGMRTRETDETGLISCNMFMKKDIFKKMKGFDTDIFPNEENELMHRVKAMGYKLLYVPGMHVYHHRRPTLKGFFTQALFYGISRAQLIKKHPRVAKIFHLAPSAFVLLLLLTPLLCFSLPGLWPAYIVFVGIYFFLMLSLGVYNAFRFGDARLALMMPAMLFMLHFAYGIGFIWGLFK